MSILIALIVEWRVLSRESSLSRAELRWVDGAKGVNVYMGDIDTKHFKIKGLKDDGWGLSMASAPESAPDLDQLLIT